MYRGHSMYELQVKIRPSLNAYSEIQIQLDTTNTFPKGFYRLTATSPIPPNGKSPEDDGLYKVVRLDIPESEVQEKMRIIEEAEIPAVPEFTMGVDGTTYELYLGSGFNSVCYHWWGDPPKGWEPFASLVKWLVDQLPDDIIYESLD
jgi:hypothetical protein